MTHVRERLGEVAEFINGVAFKPDDWQEEGQRIIRIQNLTNHEKPFNRTSRIVDKKYHVHPGDLLVSWSATLGVFTWAGPDTALVNQHIFRVVPEPERVDRNYLRHMLTDALIEMERHLHGATMKHVNRSEFLSTQIPLPPLAEQKRIAAILDAADALRAKRRESLAQLDTLLQSTFLELFGDPVTNPKGWKKHALGDLTIKITDGEHLNPEFSVSGMPIIMAGNVLESGVDLVGAKRVDISLGERFRRKCAPERNDILLVSRGATIGRMCLVYTSHPFCLMGSVILIKPDASKVHSGFLSGFLRHPAIRATLYKTSGSSAQQAIYIKDVRKLSCVTPPLESQRHFASIMESVERQKARLRAHLAELDSLFASLQTRAFNGEL